MSQANAEIVRSAFQAFATEGVEAGISFFASDVVYCPTDRWLDGSVYRGREGMRTLAVGWSDNFDSWGYQVEDVRAAADCIVALTYMVGQIKNSEQSVSQPLGLVFSDFRLLYLGRGPESRRTIGIANVRSLLSLTGPGGASDRLGSRAGYGLTPSVRVDQPV